MNTWVIKSCHMEYVELERSNSKDKAKYYPKYEELIVNDELLLRDVSLLKGLTIISNNYPAEWERVK